MMDWSKWATEPNENNFNDYPTIIDIIQDIIHDEESHTINRYPLLHMETIITRMTREGRYMVMSVSGENGDVELLPTSKTPMLFYRGQREFYKECLSSLSREKENIKKETLRSRLQISELKLCLISHPVIRDIMISRFSFGEITNVQIPIHIEGLAQHYGIKTTLLDLSSDKWVAAFFATTKDVGGKRIPINTNDSICPKYGVFYRYLWARPTGELRSGGVHAIGIQYFNRPGRQSAIVMDLKDGLNFNNMDGVEKIFFRHDNRASDLIYNMSQQGRKYFPEDALNTTIKPFLNNTVFSIDAINLCRETYYPSINSEDFRSLIAKENFSISKDRQLSFNPKDCEQEFEYWKQEGRQRYLNQLLVIPVARINI